MNPVIQTVYITLPQWYVQYCNGSLNTDDSPLQLFNDQQYDYKKGHIREFPGQVKETMERLKWLRPDHDWNIFVLI